MKNFNQHHFLLFSIVFFEKWRNFNRQKILADEIKTEKVYASVIGGGGGVVVSVGCKHS